MNAMFTLAVMFSAIDKMTGPTKKIFNSLKNHEKMFESGKNIAEYGKQLSVAGAMTQGAADKIIGALRSIEAPTQGVSDELAFLSTVTTSTLGSVDKSMAATRKAAIDWSKKHSDTAESYIKSAYRMASAGMNDVQSIEGVAVALRVAKATAGDAAETTSVLATLYNNLADKTKPVRQEMTKLGDILTRTQQYYQIANLRQLSDGLTYAAPSALQFGSSVEEVNAILGLLNSAGVQGAMAGTAYAATMRTMIKASDELGFTLGRNEKGGISFIKTIENIRKKYGEFSQMSDKTKMAFQKSFGDEGLRAVALLLGKTEDMNKALRVVTNSAGAAAAAQRQMELKSPGEQYQILQNNIDAVKMSLATNLLPTINAMLPKVVRLIDRLGRFVDAHPGIAKTALLLLGLGGVLLAIVAPIMTVTGGFISMVGFGIQGFSKLSKGILFIQKLATSGKILSSLKLISSVSRTAFSVVARAILGASQAVWSFTAALLANPITWIVIAVIALAVAAYLIIKNWTKVKAFFVGLWAGVVAIWGKMPGWLKGIITVMLYIFAPFIVLPILIIKNWKQITTFFTGLWAGIVAIWNRILPYVKVFAIGLLTILFPFVMLPILIIRNWNTLGPALMKIISGIGNWISNIAKQAWEWGANLLGNFVKGIMEKVKAVKKALIHTAEQIKNFLGFHSPAKEGPGSTAHRWAPNLMTMYESGIMTGIPRVRKAAMAAALSVSMAMAQTPGVNLSGRFSGEPANIPAISLSGNTPSVIRLTEINRREEPTQTKERPVIRIETMNVYPQNGEDFLKQLQIIAEEVG